MSSRVRVALVVVLAVLAALLVPGRSEADAVVTTATCRATEPMEGRGSVTILFGTFPITVPVAELGDAISGALSTAELPLPIPTDIDAPAEIQPGGSIPYSGDLQIDLGSNIADLMVPVRAAIVAAGYPELADTLQVGATAQNIRIPFIHPAGTTPRGAPTATGTGVSASFVGSTTVLSLNSFAFDTTAGGNPIDASVGWTVDHTGGNTDPLDLRLGTTTFGLDIAIKGSVPGDLVRPLVPPLYQSLVPDVVPIAGGATGPWACTPDDPATPIAHTAINPDSPTTTTTTNPVCTTGFNDVSAQHQFCRDIAWFSTEGLTNGYPDGSYRPVAPVTRQAIAAMLYRAKGKPEVPASAPRFADVPAGHPFEAAIRWLASEGITTGYPDHTFRPGATISRQAIAAMFHRSEGTLNAPANAPTFTDVPVGHPFATAIRWLASEQITTGYPDGTFRPEANVTRQSAAAFFHRWIA